jgi:hypothetical protein
VHAALLGSLNYPSKTLDWAGNGLALTTWSVRVGFGLHASSFHDPSDSSLVSSLSLTPFISFPLLHENDCSGIDFILTNPKQL